MPETPLSPSAVYSARPTVQIDTQAYPLVTELMLSMQMIEHEGGMSTLELRVSNIASDPQGGANFAFEDNAILKLGATIVVYGGDVTAPRELFRGIITGLEAEFSAEGPPALTVLAEDAFQRARMARRTKLHETVTIADLASDLANQLSLTPKVTGFTDNIGTQVQLNESDLAFLRRLVDRYDGDMQVVANELHVSPRKDVQRGTVELVVQSQLHQARVLADLSHQVTAVTTAGWDAVQGERITGTSSGAHLGPGSGQTGAQILQNAIGQRSQHVGHLAVTTSDEAQAVADAAYDTRARRFVCLEGTAEGNPSLRVGTLVRITGMGSRFDNTYYVTRATHRFDLEHGYETDFKAECAYWGAS